MMLWPGYWSNPCCSHPREGESDEVAVHRRRAQELGTGTGLKFLYKFVYRDKYENVGVEHEMCSGWVGRAEVDEVTANRNEISDWTFVSAQKLDNKLESSPELYTPWMKMEWMRMTHESSADCV
jgi:isopentenyl-diphosphate delta-isomerase